EVGTTALSDTSQRLLCQSGRRLLPQRKNVRVPEFIEVVTQAAAHGFDILGTNVSQKEEVMLRTKMAGVALILMVWAPLLPRAVSAQQTTSGIAGVVRDDSGGVLPGVT